MTSQDIKAAGFVASVTFGAVTSGLSVLGGAVLGTANLAKNLHAASIGTLSSAASYGVVSSGGGTSTSTGSHIMDKHK